MNGDIGTSTQAPQMRALLFTDLCDSLILVERIGDAAAAELFQEHDRLVLNLQQRWNGQLIDRSDGLFLLFERPVDALGFALDYQRSLSALGTQRRLEVCARAGLNVGEVILWNNSAEAVAHGAKPVEVEGLAKPMAARLMQLARPGQILLSAAADSMVRRSSSELGERAHGLKWRSHGRWRFKGVEPVQEVFEVGETDVAQFRRPRGHGKARPSTPWWRKPMALGVQMVIASVLLVAGWALLRPVPAIAFAERDWVVLADVQNLSGNMLLDDGFEQAFRISLEQSRFVNVLSNLKVEEALGRMQRERPTLDLDAAVEVASREGARAVVVPRVEEVSGRLRVTAQLVDPVSRKVVWSTSAEDRGLNSLFASTDSVTAALRKELGEALQQVSQTSLPLPQVATTDLDALHAYAVGLQAYGDGHYAEATRYFDQATRFDPSFAFAYLGLMRIDVLKGDLDQARAMLDKATAIRTRLPGRDRLYLDAWAVELRGGRVEDVAAKWKLLADLYPDYHGAFANYAWAMQTLGHYVESEAAARRAAVSSNALQSIAWQDVGRAQLAQNRFGDALESYRVSAKLGRWTSNRHVIAATAASGDIPAAMRMIEGEPEDELSSGLEGVAVAIDAGDAGRAWKVNKHARANCGDGGLACELFDLQGLMLGVATDKPTTAKVFEKKARELLRLATDTKGNDRQDWLFMAAATVYGAQRAGHPEVAVRLLEPLRTASKALNDARCAELITIVEANGERLAGQQEQAVKRLQPLLDGTELYQARVVLWQALAGQAGTQQQDARKWLLAQAGRAYAESAGSYVLQVFNTHDLRMARLQETPGQRVVTGQADASAARRSLR